MSCSTPSISPRRLISTATDLSVGVPAHQVDGPDGGRELSPDERQAVGERGRVVGQQLLEVLLDTVLLQARIVAEVMGGVVVDLIDEDPQRVVRLAGNCPLDPAIVGGALPQRARRADPVQGLVGPAVAVDQYDPSALDHQHSRGHRQMGGQAAGVVHLTSGYDESHGGNLPVAQGCSPYRPRAASIAAPAWVSAWTDRNGSWSGGRPPSWSSPCRPRREMHVNRVVVVLGAEPVPVVADLVQRLGGLVRYVGREASPPPARPRRPGTGRSPHVGSVTSHPRPRILGPRIPGLERQLGTGNSPSRARPGRASRSQDRDPSDGRLRPKELKSERISTGLPSEGRGDDQPGLSPVAEKLVASSASRRKLRRLTTPVSPPSRRILTESS